MPPFDLSWAQEEPCRVEDPGAARARRSARNGQSGRAAEDIVACRYRARGASVLAQRWRGGGGEIDLVLAEGDVMVFVEVKRRGRGMGPDSPISDRQWRRLGDAALSYMMDHREVTGTWPVCRFDAAIVGIGAQVELIENARSFEAY